MACNFDAMANGAPPVLELRRALPADYSELRNIARLEDRHRAPAGLVAVRDGRIIGAVSIDGRDVITDSALPAPGVAHLLRLAAANSEALFGVRSSCSVDRIRNAARGSSCEAR